MYYNFKNLLFKDGFMEHRNNKSVYYNLYNALKNAIMNKEIPDNFKLPPSRIMAKDLSLSRSTVIKAYELLVLENLVVSRQGSGYYTNKLRDDFNVKDGMTLQKKEPKVYPKISKLGKSFIQNSDFNVGENDPGSVCFRPGLPPLDLFPTMIWQKLTNEYWKHVKYSDLSYSDSLGMESLRANIAKYLKIYRNISCDPNQIVITTGSLHSLSLISRAILNTKDSVVLENPTYKKAYNLFKSLRANIHTADLSDDNFNISSLDDIASKLLYVIPSNQYPSGKRMSLNRRRELLDLAARKNILIVEDDYDHEFSNWDKPISSIFSLDINDSVVYLGTFNKLLHPSLRLGYMIIPKFLISPITAISKQTFRFVPPSLQNVMAQFISNDYLNKHLRKVIKTSNQRKLVFINHFETLFKGEIKLEINNTGLHIIGILKDHIKDFEFCNYLLENNIITFPLSSYYVSDDYSRNGLVMGYCAVNKIRIKKTLDKMYTLYLEYLSDNAQPH
ncbi:MocR-like pyridoxine biosynthesis transcription factor PdxR [Sinomicrobium soli]|uniref:MocR-like pyridoxine biosynthesis transcription factor PdxR n=1 Tax=Sinomicrobium sp. N-1-3-6 TaxID=2219864 RepID=UPI000DCB519D|nr:PLP-dependent aminotransferase family protein [Sinomicrobium sp. N-1-3-6]RAV29659.1 hypothetical protein DN748_05935 [Sinomicrobium sp. N-1-3-6]